MGGNDPSEIQILANLSSELIYVIFLDRFAFVSYALRMNSRKKWNLAEKFPQIPIFDFEKLKNAENLMVKRRVSSLKVKTRTLAHPEVIAGVLRNILTKFEENSSTGFAGFCVLVCFQLIFGNLHRVPPMKPKKNEIFFEISVFALKPF